MNVGLSQIHLISFILLGSHSNEMIGSKLILKSYYPRTYVLPGSVANSSSKSLQNQEMPMRIAWVTRSFLDYRVPVFAALDELLNHQLHVLFSRDLVPERVCNKMERLLGSRAIGLSGEWQLGRGNVDDMANNGVSVQFHPHVLKKLKMCRPDVLVGDGFFKWTAAALLYKLKRGIPVVVCYERTFHTERHAQWFRKLYRRAVVRLLDAVCCSGRLCVEYVRCLGMPDARITTGHIASDTEALAQQNSLVTAAERSMIRRQWNVQGLAFLVMGRLSYRKGLRQLLDAWVDFERAHPGAGTVVLVGDGPESGFLRQFVSENKLSNVRLPGSVDYSQVARFYAAADALVVPTLEDNWSLVVSEAMACGLPILCSKYNGCYPELIQPGENGWIFDPLDRSDLVKTLNKCLSAKDRLLEMGQRSRQIVSNHTAEHAAQAILRACEIAIGQTAN